MKITELRNSLKKHKRDDLEYLVAELYKLVPKNKKEEYQIDDLIMQGKPKKGSEKQIKNSQVRSIMEIAVEVDAFIENAQAFNYLSPNQKVAKKDRPKWRFLVKRLYKEILAAANDGNAAKACCNEMVKLYELLTYACHYILFNSYDVFDSIGISQTDFFTTVTTLQRKHLGGKDFVKQASRLALNNPLNRYTLYSGLMNIVIEHCPTPDMKRALCNDLLEFYTETINAPDNEKDYPSRDRKYSFIKMSKLNTIAESLLTIYLIVNEFDEGITFFNNAYLSNEPEIKLYVLVRNLFDQNKPQLIVNQINSNLKINPRKSLLALRDYIEKNKVLPKYMN
ncbi:MAG: hypothetical protein PF517_20560 [Salinivirgaceae bacterium]|jgi:hypothetical protein|nr:hypothetical protein [Salinivirgaceae bacterium]